MARKGGTKTKSHQIVFNLEELSTKSRKFYDRAFDLAYAYLTDPLYPEMEDTSNLPSAVAYDAAVIALCEQLYEGVPQESRVISDEIDFEEFMLSYVVNHVEMSMKAINEIEAERSSRISPDIFRQACGANLTRPIAMRNSTKTVVAALENITYLRVGLEQFADALRDRNQRIVLLDNYVSDEANDTTNLLAYLDTASLAGDLDGRIILIPFRGPHLPSPVTNRTIRLSLEEPDEETPTLKEAAKWNRP